jgi:hypothetical protein
VTDYKPNDDIREDLEITDISMKQSVEIAWKPNPEAPPLYKPQGRRTVLIFVTATGQVFSPPCWWQNFKWI